MHVWFHNFRVPALRHCPFTAIMLRAVSLSSLLFCLWIAIVAAAARSAEAAACAETLNPNNNNASCDAIADQGVCKKTAGCTWCVSAAVPSSCFSESDAAKLPVAVFTCSKEGGGAPLSSVE